MSEKNEPSLLWKIAKEIVADAVALPPSEREAFIQSRCRNVNNTANNTVVDQVLLNEVRSLLAFSGDTDSFIDKPPIFSGIVPESPILQRDWQHETLGAWQLDREIGRGGMGMVYLAHRADGAYQQVAAIKLLRGGIGRANDAKSISRMQRERQTLAALSHPNIARLLDGGNAPDHTPYLVMEYVEGQAIDAYCQSHQLSIAARIGVMVSVCAAVQSAHQRLVIHRDLKPSNVMVTADGVPKLLDFGVARLLESQDNEIEQTQNALLFTPRYASPEQVRGLPVSVATDVYGLGLLLYELLAGESPYERLSSNSTNAATNAAAVMQTVMGDALRKPSDVAKLYQPAHVEALRGDLDTILLKACAKDVNERYATVADLSADLTRYLQNRPIAARKPTWSYVANKFVRRNVVGVVLGAVAIAAIGLGFAGTVIQKNHAEAERARADAQSAQTRKLANKLIFDYYAQIEPLAGALSVRKKMLEDAGNFLDQIPGGTKLDIDVAVETATAYRRLADALYNGRGASNLGDKEGSQAASKKAKAILDVVLAEAPNDRNANLEMGRYETNMGHLLRQDAGAATVDYFQSAVKRYDMILARTPSDYVVTAELTRTYLADAMAKRAQKKAFVEPIKSAELTLEKLKKNAEAKTNPALRLEIGKLNVQVINLKLLDASRNERVEESLSLSDQQISAYAEMLKEWPNDMVLRRGLADGYSSKAVLLMNDKRNDEALLALDKSIEVNEKNAVDNLDDVLMFANVGRVYYYHARANIKLQNFNAALQDLTAGTQRFSKADTVALPPAMRKMQCQSFALIVAIATKQKKLSIASDAEQSIQVLAQKQPSLFADKPVKAWITEARELLPK